MADTSANVQLTCPKRGCKQPIEIDQRWTSGGVNDYGGYVLKCTKCGNVFDFRLGRDVQDSRVTSGATVLDTYFDEGQSKAAVLKKHGLV